MQVKLNRLTEVEHSTELTGYCDKTKAMRIGTQNRTHFQVNYIVIEDAERFCYLGSILCTYGGSVADVEYRIMENRQVFGTQCKRNKDVTLQQQR